MIRTLKHLFVPNPLDDILSDAVDRGLRKILIVWNRGLGDIALGLFPLTHRIREYLPQAEITFLTRPDLEEGFLLLHDIAVISSPTIKRGKSFSVEEELRKTGHSPADFDLIMEKPDPTRWLYPQIGKLTPKLTWRSEWDTLHKKFVDTSSGISIGVHVQTETNYNYEKNWPVDHWRRFFAEAKKLDARIFLFGFSPQPVFEGENIVDLRGKTNLLEMLSIIKSCCTHLVVPDSGVLCLAYYLDIVMPLHIVSLWADPRQGILRQKVASPNPALMHMPFVGRNKDTSRIPVEEVLQALKSKGTCKLKKF